MRTKNSKRFPGYTQFLSTTTTMALLLISTAAVVVVGGGGMPVSVSEIAGESEAAETEHVQQQEAQLSKPIADCVTELKSVREEIADCLAKLGTPNRSQTTNLLNDETIFQECHNKVVQSNPKVAAKVENCERIVHSPENSEAENIQVQKIFQSWGRL